MDIVVIRNAEHADIPKLIELSTALSMEDGQLHGEAINHDWARDHGAESFAKSIDAATSCILVALVNDQVIGSLHGYTQQAPLWRPVDIAVIISVFVESESRGSGVGTQLLSAFRTWAEESGAKRMAVSAFATNQAAIRFYQREGFAPFEVTLEKKLS